MVNSVIIYTDLEATRRKQRESVANGSLDNKRYTFSGNSALPNTSEDAWEMFSDGIDIGIAEAIAADRAAHDAAKKGGAA